MSELGVHVDHLTTLQHLEQFKIVMESQQKRMIEQSRRSLNMLILDRLIEAGEDAEAFAHALSI